MTKRPPLPDLALALALLLSVGLQLSGILVPGWWYLPPDHPYHHQNSINVIYSEDDSKARQLNDSSGTTTYGLWTIVHCREDGVCVEAAVDTSGANAWLQVTQVFESGAVAFGVLALLCDVFACIKDMKIQTHFLLRRLTVVLLAVVVVSILIGMGVFLKKSAGLARYPQRTTAGGHLDWPIFLSTAAAAMSLLLAVLIGLRMRCHLVTGSSC